MFARLKKSVKSEPYAYLAGLAVVVALAILVGAAVKAHWESPESAFPLARATGIGGEPVDAGRIAAEGGAK